MALLEEDKKRQLILKEKQLSVAKLLEYIQKFENVCLDDFTHMAADRRTWIQEKLASVPNPSEQAQWNRIQARLQSPDAALLAELDAYIRNWGITRPVNNHVDEAQSLLTSIQADIEETDWQNLNPQDKYALKSYLQRYPHTTHKNEIDQCYWGLCHPENLQVNEMKDYLSLFPNGLHAHTAQDALDSQTEWEEVKRGKDIVHIHHYLQAHPTSPFAPHAHRMWQEAKDEEIHKMRTDPNHYETDKLMSLLDTGIFSEQELIDANVMTENIIRTLREGDIERDLPDINKAIETSYPECKPGYTDVFFFGIPSTGKTCVLMGLTRSQSLHINLAHGGGDYAEALQQYTDVGKTVPPTRRAFVTTLEATISGRSTNGVSHKVNLVEMAGEDFAFEVAHNPNHIFSFEDMGTGATKLLQNQNRKVFFIIIDPTTNVVRVNREVIKGYDEMTGEPVKELERCIANQATIIQRLVNLFQLPENEHVMKNVDSIHFIVTKADTLGDRDEREKKAQKIFYDRFANSILEPLLDLCEKLNINANSEQKHHPKLYTFSLGTFYVGGLYEYDSTDSNRLVTAIRNCTEGTGGRASFKDKVKDLVN